MRFKEWIKKRREKAEEERQEYEDSKEQCKNCGRRFIVNLMDGYECNGFCHEFCALKYLLKELNKLKENKE